MAKEEIPHGAEYGGVLSIWLTFSFFYSPIWDLADLLICRTFFLTVTSLGVILLSRALLRLERRHVVILAVLSFVTLSIGWLGLALLYAYAEPSIPVMLFFQGSEAIGSVGYFCLYAAQLSREKHASKFIRNSFLSGVVTYATLVFISNVSVIAFLSLNIAVFALALVSFLKHFEEPVKEASSGGADGSARVYFGYNSRRMALSAACFGLLTTSAYGVVSYPASLGGTAVAAAASAAVLINLCRGIDRSPLSDILGIGRLGMLVTALGLFLFISLGGGAFEILSFTCSFMGVALFLSSCLMSISSVRRYQSVPDVGRRCASAIASILGGMAIGYAALYIFDRIGADGLAIAPVVAAVLLVVSEFLHNQPSLFPSTIDREPAFEEKMLACLELAEAYELTERQREILLLEVEGLSNAQIAERLFLSPNTVRYHQHQTYRKLGVDSASKVIGLVRDNAASTAADMAAKATSIQ